MAGVAAGTALGSTHSGVGSGTGGTAPPISPLAGTAADDSQYSTEETIAAVLLSLLIPVIALIVALAMRARELRPRRTQLLRNWAIGSAAWLCTGWLVAIIAFSAVGSGPSGCQGGIDQSVPPSYQSNDGMHWAATYTCMNGGTKTKSVPSSQVPGG